MIAEKMAVKFTRGIANTATCIVELPKQTMLTVRDMGGVGYVVGPAKGVIMTLYRGIIGMTEALFFLVPQPGYYDPMIEPSLRVGRVGTQAGHVGDFLPKQPGGFPAGGSLACCVSAP